MDKFAGYVYDFDKENDIIWFTIIDDQGIEAEYEGSFDFVIEEHRHLIEKGVYVHLLEDDETGQCISAVDEPHRWTQEEIDECQKRADELYKALHWQQSHLPCVEGAFAAVPFI